MFAWQSYERGTDVHLQADPTKLELLAKEVDKRKEDFKASAKGGILQTYGGEEHLEAPPKQLLLAQTVCSLSPIFIDTVCSFCFTCAKKPTDFNISIFSSAIHIKKMIRIFHHQLSRGINTFV